MFFWLKKLIASRQYYSLKRFWHWGLGITCLCLILAIRLAPVQAQPENAAKRQEDVTTQQYSLPASVAQAPVVQSQPESVAPSASTPPEDNSESPGDEALGPLSQYLLQFNRSPIVGNALQMEGILSQSRLGFTRPPHWEVESAKLQLRFRHSPALYAERSTLTVKLNNAHLGSVPLSRGPDEIGNLLFDVPAGVIQDYNEIVMQVQQHTSPDCTDPTDPALWTEILPDSQVIINYRPREIALDLANYPYPFLNDLGLDADQLAYLQPEEADDVWMTAAARYQASAARSTNFRSIQTRLVKDLSAINGQERLIIIGSPATQPALSELESLPFEIQNNQLLDANGNALPDTVGIVMLTTTNDFENPVLVITGNSDKGVLKALQALVQPSDRQLLAGQTAIIKEVAEEESPAPYNWAGYLPQGVDRFQLTDLMTADLEPFQSVTVNGLPVPPAVQIPFKSLPNEQFLKGSTFTLQYSYSPNVDPTRSSVSVRLDGQELGGERLQNTSGGRDSITVDIPPEPITPFSNLEVQFFTYPKTAVSCGNIPDQPMSGTVHGSSSFKLNRTNVFQLPDLKLLQTGFPLTAPQDLSQMAFVLPENPSDIDLLTMLQASSRLGRLSRADSVKLGAYSAENLPQEVRQNSNLVGIGVRDRFPLPQLFEEQTSFALGEQFLRRQNSSQVQTFPDQAGVIEAIVSPWNPERILLGLTGQSETGLTAVQQVFYQDALFSQLEGDTLLVRRNPNTPPVLARDNFQITPLSQNASTTIDNRGILNRAIAVLQNNWVLIPGGILLIVLIFYGVSQLYLNRFSHSRGQNV